MAIQDMNSTMVITASNGTDNKLRLVATGDGNVRLLSYEDEGKPHAQVIVDIHELQTVLSHMDQLSYLGEPLEGDDMDDVVEESVSDA